MLRTLMVGGETATPNLLSLLSAAGPRAVSFWRHAIISSGARLVRGATCSVGTLHDPFADGPHPLCAPF